MEATKKFIEEAIKGGWNYKHASDGEVFINDWNEIEDGLTVVHIYVDDGKGTHSGFDFMVEEALLDPLAWQAVGKQRNWEDSVATDYFDSLGDKVYVKGWVQKRADFLTWLDSGLSVDEALRKLEV